MARNTRLVSIKGCPMVIFEAPECISDEIVKYNNFWEYEVFDKWKQHFPKEGLMLDIGANIGGHCIQFHHHFPNLKIWGFEPYPPNYELLRVNVENLQNVHSFSLGVGSGNSMVHFGNEYSKNCGSVMVVNPDENCFTKPYSNFVIALDTIKFPEPVKFIKIDIEGHEYSAYEGAKELLLRDKPLVWLEDHGQPLGEGDSIKYLEGLGYKMLDSYLERDDKSSTSSDFLMYHPDNVWYK